MTEFETLMQQATGISCHTAEVQPGHIFVALKGRKLNGNGFAHLAAQKGAIAIVTDEPDSIATGNIPLFAVQDARKYLSDLAATYYHHPSQQLSITGITGTNGKTTIAYMLYKIFQQAGFASGLIGTIQVHLGSKTLPSTLTTPDAITLQKYLAQMLQEKITHVAMEVSAQGVEMHRVNHVKFSCGILSNITPDHLDFHDSFADYLEAKKRFLKLLKPSQPLIVNIADKHCRDIAQTYTGNLIRVNPAPGQNSLADVEVKVASITAYQSQFELLIRQPFVTTAGTVIKPACLKLALRLPGRHNIENAALASVAALALGISPQDIAAALSDFRPVERRMVVSYQQGLTIIDDTALNPGSIDAVFSALASFTYKKLIVVNAIRGNRGTAINALNAACLSKWQKQLGFTTVITASRHATPNSDIVSKEEQAGFLSTLEQQKTPYIFKDFLADALKIALSLTGSGDLLLLIGAQGMDKGYAEVTQLLAVPQATAAVPFYEQPVLI